MLLTFEDPPDNIKVSENLWWHNGRIRLVCVFLAQSSFLLFYTLLCCGLGSFCLGKAVLIRVLRESLLMGNMHFSPCYGSSFIVPAVAFSHPIFGI